MRWILITGEYPPTRGGVADYTALLAASLDRSQEEVHVIAPFTDAAFPESGNLHIHPLPDKYSLSSVLKLNQILARVPHPRRLFVQYVAQGFGWRGMNLAFCLWLYSRRKRETIWTMFHEVAMPLSWKNRLRMNILGLVTAVMARLVLRASDKVFVSTTAWRSWLGSMGAEEDSIDWLPISSNIPEAADSREAQRVRSKLCAGNSDVLIGHFGTFTAHTLPVLTPLLVPLLLDEPRRRLLLVGRDGETFAAALSDSRPELRNRILAPGFLTPEEVAVHLAACDLLLQPYVDGITTRRTTAMAGLALGLPILTNSGRFTEPIWSEQRAVALSSSSDPQEMIAIANELLNDPERRKDLGRRAKSFYATHMSRERALEKLQMECEMSSHAA